MNKNPCPIDIGYGFLNFILIKKCNDLRSAVNVVNDDTFSFHYFTDMLKFKRVHIYSVFAQDEKDNKLIVDYNQFMNILEPYKEI